MNALTPATLDREAGYRLVAELQDEQELVGLFGALDERADTPIHEIKVLLTVVQQVDFTSGADHPDKTILALPAQHPWSSCHHQVRSACNA